MAFNEKYVDAAAAGGGTGTSAGDPWTWDEAVANYAAGDRVNVKVGSYTSTGTSSTVGGSLSDPIVFRGYKTTIGDLDGVSLHGLVDGVDIPVIANNTTDNAGIKGSFIYVNNISFTTNRNYSVYVWNFGLYGSVQNCRFVSTSDIASCPVQGYSFFGCYFETKSNYGAIRSASLLESCVIRGNRTQYSGSASDPVGVNTIGGPVNNCIFINDSTGGIGGTAMNMSYPYAGLVSNCTFINWTNAVTSSTNNPDRGARYICNSYFANCTNAFYDSYRTNATEPLFHLINNGFYNVASQANSSVVFNFNPKVDTIDPFVDSANSDYRLTSSSVGYGYSEQRQLAYLNTVNNRDLGALQHADPAYVAPPDASASTKIFPFRSWVEGDFQQEGADSDEFVEKQELEAGTVYEFTVGSGADRDYSSVAAFVAAFDNTLINVPNSKVIVTCYNDTGADQAVETLSSQIFIENPSNCTDLIITVDDDSWHKGQFDKGYVLRAGYSYISTGMVHIRTMTCRFLMERLIIDGNAQNTASSVQALIYNDHTNATLPAYFIKYHNLLFQGSDGTTYGTNNFGAVGITGSKPIYVSNCVVRNIMTQASGNRNCWGMNIHHQSTVTNCVVYNTVGPNLTSTNNYGIIGPSSGAVNNCIVMETINDAIAAGIPQSNNVTDDSSGTYQSTPAGEFVDAANGDFKLKGTATSAGIGYTANAKVTDITGKLRKAGVAQDAGAFNNVAGYDDSPVFPPDQPTDPIIHPLRSN